EWCPVWIGRCGVGRFPDAAVYRSHEDDIGIGRIDGNRFDGAGDRAACCSHGIAAKDRPWPLFDPGGGWRQAVLQTFPVKARAYKAPPRARTPTPHKSCASHDEFLAYLGVRSAIP